MFWYSSVLISLILINLNLMNFLECYEVRYVQNSEEYDKKFLIKSIQSDKIQKFIPRFDLKYVKRKRIDTNKINNQIANTNLNFHNIDELNHGNHTNFESVTSPFNQNFYNLTNNSSSNDVIVNDDDDSHRLQSVHSYQISHLNNSFTSEKLPIYFTNPVSGIVYAITEVGYNYSKPSISKLANNSIPIYIPKEQYDRDMNLMKLKYMEKCRMGKQQKNNTIKIESLPSDMMNTKKNKISPVVMVKPLKISKKRKTKKHHHHHQKPASTSSEDDLSGFENVLNEVFEVVEDGVMSSEEVNSTHKKKKRKSKAKNKIDIIKPTLTSNSIKNGPQTTKIISTNNRRKAHHQHHHRTQSVKLNGTGTLDNPVVVHHHHQRPQITETTPIRIRKLLSINNDAAADDDAVTGIPIVRYTTPSQLELNFPKRIFKRSIPSSSTTTQPSTVMEKPAEEITKTSRVYQILSRPTTPKTPCNHTKSKSPTKTNQKNHYDDGINNYDDDNDYYIEYSDFPFTEADYVSDADDHHHHHNKESSNHVADDDDDYYDYNKSPTQQTTTDHALSSVGNLEQNDNKVLVSQKNNADAHRTRKNIRKKLVNRKRKPILELDEDDEAAEVDQFHDDDDNDDDYDGEIEEDDDELDMLEIFNIFYYPARKIFSKILFRAGVLTGLVDNEPVIVVLNNNNDNDNDNDNDLDHHHHQTVIDKRKPKFPKYTVYNNKVEPIVEPENNSWFGSWFSFTGTEDEVKPVPDADNESTSGWFDSWFDTTERSTTPSTSTQSSNYESWFLNWFDSSSPKTLTTTKKSASISDTSTTSSPAVLSLDPSVIPNSQKLITILAQHIVNSTVSSSTTTPIQDDTPKFISYNNCRILRLKPSNGEQFEFLDEYKSSEDGAKLQWLQGPTLRGLTDVLVPQKHLTDFQGTLNYENIAHNVLIFDVGKAISYERLETAIKDSSKEHGSAMFWNQYQSYDKIIRYIEMLQLRNPQLVELFHIGRSYEGRPLVIVKIAQKPTTDTKIPKLKLQKKKGYERNGIFIEAGIHGREWITPATATWILNELITIMTSNTSNPSTDFIKSQTWFVMPVLNPDGYEYTREFDRFWTKSRSMYLSKPNGIINSALNWFQKTNSNKICFGVDLNQNWEYNWNGKGSSKSPCNQYYAGPNAFSEPETRSVSQFLIDYRKKIKLFISLEAYGQIIAYPNKLNGSFDGQKIDDLLDVALVGSDALRKSGSNSRYRIDSSNELIAPQSGSSTYFATYEAGIPFSYTIYLADNGVHGYLLPGSSIEPTAKDAFHLIKAMSDYI